MTDTAIAEHLIAGPKAGLSYPLTVQYCGHCTMPLEYCEYYPDYEKCKAWLEKNLPTEFDKVRLSDEATAAAASTEDGAGDDEKKRQKRGGKGMLKAKKPKAEDGPRKVTVSRAPRGKKKSVTVVTGLNTYGKCRLDVRETKSRKSNALFARADIDLKVAAKFFSSKFACSSSVTGDDEIIIQGDVKDELFDVIPEKWPEIDEDAIDDLGDQKR